jgi:hypothetical protein
LSLRAWISSFIATSHSGVLAALLNPFSSFITRIENSKGEDGTWQT